jgi:hypothetical protein
MDSFERQQVLDDEHLRLLRIGYFVMGGLSVFMCIFGVFYALMGAFIVATIPSTQRATGQPPPTFIAWFFAAFGLLFVIFGGGYAALSFLTARSLRLRRSRTICLVTAGISCLHIPFGTLIGVFTFSVLGRPSVLRLFGQASPASTQPPLPTPPPSPPSVGPVA